MWLAVVGEGGGGSIGRARLICCFCAGLIWVVICDIFLAVASVGAVDVERYCCDLLKFCIVWFFPFFQIIGLLLICYHSRLYLV